MPACKCPPDFSLNPKRNPKPCSRLSRSNLDPSCLGAEALPRDDAAQSGREKTDGALTISIHQELRPLDAHDLNASVLFNVSGFSRPVGAIFWLSRFGFLEFR